MISATSTAAANTAKTAMSRLSSSALPKNMSTVMKNASQNSSNANESRAAASSLFAGITAAAAGSATGFNKGGTPVF